MRWINRVRRALIRLLIGRMEVCCNMTVEGEIAYSGSHGGVVEYGSLFLEASGAKIARCDAA
jgi:hypothetical protein